MRKGWKRIGSLLLAICIMLPLLPKTVQAAVTDANDWAIFTVSEYDNPETQEVVLQRMLLNDNNLAAPWGTIVKEIIKQQKGDGPGILKATLPFQELTAASTLVMKDSLKAVYDDAAGKLTGFINGLASIDKGDLAPTVSFLNSQGSKIAGLNAEGPAFARYQIKTLTSSAFNNYFPGYYGSAGAITIQLFYDFKVEGLPGRFDTPDFAVGDSMAGLHAKGIIYALGGSSDSYTVKAENYNDFPNTVQKSYTYEKSTATSTEVSSSYSKTWTEETTVGVDIKIPFVNLVSAKVEQKVGYSYSIGKTYSSSTTDTYTQSISDTIEVPLPPHTGIDIDVNIIDTTTTIPYTGAARVTYKTMVVYAAGISEHEDGTGSRQNVNGSFSFGDETYTAVQDLDRRIINAALGSDPDGLNLKATSPGLMANSGFAASANKLRSGQPYSPYGGVFNYTSKGTTITPRKVVPLYPAARFTPDVEDITLYEQQSRRLDGIKLAALNEYDVPYYGFNARLGGVWTVVDGDGNVNAEYAEITTDRNGYPVLKAIAPGDGAELYLRYSPDTTKVSVSGGYVSETISLTIKSVALSDVTLSGSFADYILNDGENTADASALTLAAKDLDGKPFIPAPSAIKWFAEEEGQGITVDRASGAIEYDRAGTYQIYAVVNETESNRVSLTILPARQLAEITVQGEIPILVWNDGAKNTFGLNQITVEGCDQYGDSCAVSGFWALGSDSIEEAELRIARVEAGTDTLVGLRAGSDMLWLRQNIGTEEDPVYVESNRLAVTVQDAPYPKVLLVSGEVPDLYYNHETAKSFDLTSLNVHCYDQYGEPYALDPIQYLWSFEKGGHAKVADNVITGLVVGSDRLTLSYPTEAKDDQGNPLVTISASPLDVAVKALPYVNELYQGPAIPLIREDEPFALSGITLLARDQYGNAIPVPGDIQWSLAGNNRTEAVIDSGELTVTPGQVEHASWADVILEAASPSVNRTARNVTVRVRQQPVLTRLVAAVSADFAPKWEENAKLSDHFTAEGFDQYGDPMPVQPDWSSSDPESVSLADGILTFLREDGKSVISASIGDVVSNGITITVPGTPRVTSVAVVGAPNSVDLNANLLLSNLSVRVFDQYGKQFGKDSLEAYPASVRWTLEKGTTDAAISGDTVLFGGKAGAMTLICTVVNSDTNSDLAQKRLDIQVRSGGGGGGGGGGMIIMPVKPPAAMLGSTAIITVKASIANGGATAAVTSSEIKDALSNAQEAAAAIGDTPTVEIMIENTSGASPVAVTIPGESVKGLASAGARLKITNSLGSVTFCPDALGSIADGGPGDAIFTIAKADTSGLSDDALETIGDRPVYEFSVTVGGNTIAQFDGAVAVEMPYVLGSGEDPNAVIICYIDASGDLVTVTNGRYDAAAGTVVFTITHFSRYAVGYKMVHFTDVAAPAWYHDAVVFLAARGVTTGTTDTTFGPDGLVTRGQFITLLLRAYEIAPDENLSDNFSDAGDTYYTGYLAAAKRLGISGGVGDNRFAPEQAITRQEMFTLLHNALKMLDRLPAGGGRTTLPDFADSDAIASWAQEAASALVKSGIVSGSEGRLDPMGSSTRAQMAQVLYNLLGK